MAATSGRAQYGPDSPFTDFDPTPTDFDSDSDPVKITRIAHHPRRERVRIYVDDDDEPRAELALDLLVGAGLAEGDEVTARRLAALEERDALYRARDAAVSLLAHRARSREELRRRLARKEHGPEAIDHALAWLDERGYVDDDAFAEAFVRDRLRLRPRGRLGLIRELRRKGVADAVAEAAIARVMDRDEVDENALALDAADAWARKNRSAVREAARSREGRARARRRLYGHLARRGFAPDAIRAALASVLEH